MHENGRATVWANPLFGGMIRSKKVPRQRSLSTASDFLVQPIVPGFSTSRRLSRRRTLPSLESSIYRKQSNNARCGCKKTTNLNFTGWYRPTATNAEAQNATLRGGSNRDSQKSRIMFHKQSRLSHFITVVEDTVHENPKVRPSICTILTGLIVIFFGLLGFCVPVFKLYFPLWARVAIVGGGGVVVLGGSIGTAAYFYKLKRPSKPLKYNFQLREMKGKDTKEEILRRNTKSNGKVRIPNSLEVSEEEETCEHQFLNPRSEDADQHLGGTAQQKMKYRRKLPGSPYREGRKCPRSTVIVSSRNLLYMSNDSSTNEVFLPSTKTIEIDQLTATHAIPSPCTPRRIVKPSAFYSSEPDLHASTDRIISAQNLSSNKKDNNANINSDAKTTRKACVMHHNPRTHADDLPNGDNVTIIERVGSWDDDQMKAMQILAAKEIFDVYHDPLLHRAITRIKFQCDCEFQKHDREFHNSL